MEDNQQHIDEIFFKIEDSFNSMDVELGKYMEKKLTESILTGPIPVKTGSLKSSIKVSFDTSSKRIKIGMNMYGLFVNFGVLSYTGSGPAINVDTNLWGIKPKSGSQFKFTRTPKDGQSKSLGIGIKPQKFLPTQEEIDKMIELFLEEYNTNLNSSK